MKLTKREIDLITGIEKNRRRRKNGVWWTVLVLLVTWFVLPLIGIEKETVFTLVAVAFGIAFSDYVNNYIRVRSEDKLIDLLQRYVNGDAEAIRQLLDKSEAAGSAPDYS